MPQTKPIRRFRPRLDRLEPIQLLAGGLRHAAMVHPAATVDLKGTGVAHDAALAIYHATASFRRDGVYVAVLTADDASRTIRGGAVVTYKIPVLGEVTSTVRFKTNIDNPRPRDVKVSVSKFGNFVRKGDRDKVALAVVRIIRRDHDQIVAALDAPPVEAS